MKRDVPPNHEILDVKQLHERVRFVEEMVKIFHDELIEVKNILMRMEDDGK